MDDIPTTTDTGGAGGTPDFAGTGGTPVGLAASGPARASGAPATAPRAPSWVVPMIVLALVAGLGAGLAIGLLIGGGDQEAAVTTASTAVPTTSLAPTSTTVPGGSTTTLPSDPAAYAPVAVTGDALPRLEAGVADAAIGLPVPEISGFDFDGNPHTITNNGKAKVIVALAHWCPHCNNQLPVLIDWYASTAIPDNVEVFSLTVFNDPARVNYPPSTWLRQAGWNIPVFADDAARTIATTLGIPAVPFWLIVSADGTVAARFTGGLAADQLDSVLEALGNLPETTTTTTP